jgi:hypothetical protein
MLDNPYMKAALVAFISAVLVTLYAKFNDPDEKKLASKFAQVFMAVLVSGVALSFVMNAPGGDDLMSEPFIAGGLADF